MLTSPRYSGHLAHVPILLVTLVRRPRGPLYTPAGAVHTDAHQVHPVREQFCRFPLPARPRGLGTSVNVLEDVNAGQGWTTVRKPEITGP